MIPKLLIPHTLYSLKKLSKTASNFLKWPLVASKWFKISFIIVHSLYIFVTPHFMYIQRNFQKQPLISFNGLWWPPNVPNLRNYETFKNSLKFSSTASGGLHLYIFLRFCQNNENSGKKEYFPANFPKITSGFHCDIS